jgi:RNA polymerase sigma-B factor
VERSTAEPQDAGSVTRTERLLRAYHERGDAGARERLVEMYLPLVETFAHRYERAGEYDDLFQAGSIGLLHAIDRFEIERGGELAAFAVPNIVGEIKRHLRDRTASVRLPRSLQELRARLPRAEAEAAGRLGRAATTAELARELGADEEEVERARSAARHAEPEGAGEPDDALDLSDDRMALASAFTVLDEHERRILYMRFVRDQSRARVAEQLGVSQRHLSRLTQAALAKVRAELEREGRPGRPPAAPPTPALPAPPREHKMVAMGAMRTPAPERSRKDREAHPTRPEPTHSGRLMLRMPGSLHADLARAAEREGVSLNSFIVGSLAAAVRWRRPEHEPEEPLELEEPPGPQGGSRWMRVAIVANTAVVVVAAVVAVILLIVAWQQGI